MEKEKERERERSTRARVGDDIIKSGYPVFPALLLNAKNCRSRPRAHVRLDQSGCQNRDRAVIRGGCETRLLHGSYFLPLSNAHAIALMILRFRQTLTRKRTNSNTVRSGCL